MTDLDSVVLNVQSELDADRDLASVLSTDAGRRFIWRLVEMFEVGRDSFTTDPYMNAYNQGQQSVGYRFINLLKQKHFEHFQLMERESHQDQEDIDKSQ